MAETDMYVPLRLMVQILQKILQRKQQKLIVLVVSIMLRGHDFLFTRLIGICMGHMSHQPIISRH